MPGEGQAAPFEAHPVGALQAQAAPLMAQPSDSLSQQAHPSQGECLVLLILDCRSLVSFTFDSLCKYIQHTSKQPLLLFAFLWSLSLEQTALYKRNHARALCERERKKEREREREQSDLQPTN